MVMTRSQMRRQLYRGGGIATLPRQGYGIGSWVKERIRKLIPNELANVAAKAAPFVAPFNPLAAGIMRGVGRFDKRGSISDAFKQGLLTYGGGQAARYLGGAGFQTGYNPMGGMEGMKYGLSDPRGIETGLKMRNWGDKVVKNPNEEFLKTGKRGLKTGDEKGVGFIKGMTEATIGKVPILEELPSMVKQQLFVGGVTAGASALYSFLVGDFRPQEAGETLEQYLAARKASVGKQMRTYMDNYFAYDPEYSELDDVGRDAFVAKYNMNQGGRVGRHNGGVGLDSLEDRLQTDARPIIYEGDMRTRPMAKGGRIGYAKGSKKGYADYVQAMNALGQTPMPIGIFQSLEGIMSVQEMVNMGSPKKAQGGRIGYRLGGNGNQEEAFNMSEEMKMADLDNIPDWWLTDFEELIQEFRGDNNGNNPTSINELEKWYRFKHSKTSAPDTGITTVAQGGRIGRYGGGMGLPGIPRMAPDGLEYDMRVHGGFQPLGAKEGKDDVNAKLAKNEFVFTADAVRGAGGGDVELGAQKMYDTMKKLEGRVA